MQGLAAGQLNGIEIKYKGCTNSSMRGLQSKVMRACMLQAGAAARRMGRAGMRLSVRCTTQHSSTKAKAAAALLPPMVLREAQAGGWALELGCIRFQGLPLAAPLPAPAPARPPAWLWQWPATLTAVEVCGGSLDLGALLQLSALPSLTSLTLDNPYFEPLTRAQAAGRARRACLSLPSPPPPTAAAAASPSDSAATTPGGGDGSSADDGCDSGTGPGAYHHAVGGLAALTRLTHLAVRSLWVQDNVSLAASFVGALSALTGLRSLELELPHGAPWRRAGRHHGDSVLHAVGARLTALTRLRCGVTWDAGERWPQPDPVPEPEAGSVPEVVALRAVLAGCVVLRVLELPHMSLAANSLARLGGGGGSSGGEAPLACPSLTHLHLRTLVPGPEPSVSSTLRPGEHHQQLLSGPHPSELLAATFPSLTRLHLTALGLNTHCAWVPTPVTGSHVPSAELCTWPLPRALCGPVHVDTLLLRALSNRRGLPSPPYSNAIANARAQVDAAAGLAAHYAGSPVHAAAAAGSSHHHASRARQRAHAIRTLHVQLSAVTPQGREVCPVLFAHMMAALAPLAPHIGACELSYWGAPDDEVLCTLACSAALSRVPAATLPQQVGVLAWLAERPGALPALSSLTLTRHSESAGFARALVALARSRPRLREVVVPGADHAEVVGALRAAGCGHVRVSAGAD